MSKVIVDADFLKHIIKAQNGLKTIEKIIELNNFEFVMHPWVYEREIKNLDTQVECFVNRRVEVLEYNDFLKDEDDGKLYQIYFEEIFYHMNHRYVNWGSRNFYTYRASGENLGEIHSVIMSLFAEIPLLLSDDYNAKEVAAKRINAHGHALNVKKSFDILCEIAGMDLPVIDLQDMIFVIREHKAEYHKNYISTIKRIYNNK